LVENEEPTSKVNLKRERKTLKGADNMENLCEAVTIITLVNCERVL